MTEERHAANPPARAATTRKQASLPYARGEGKLVLRIFEDCEVQTYHIPTSELKQQFVRVKGHLEKENCPGIVNKIPSQDCQECYIGKTGNLKRRLQQHGNDVAKGHTVFQALAEHHEKTGRSIDWQLASVIEKENKLSSRLLLE